MAFIQHRNSPGTSLQMAVNSQLYFNRAKALTITHTRPCLQRGLLGGRMSFDCNLKALNIRLKPVFKNISV